MCYIFISKVRCEGGLTLVAQPPYYCSRWSMGYRIIGTTPEVQYPKELILPIFIIIQDKILVKIKTCSILSFLLQNLFLNSSNQGANVFILNVAQY
jgi:hypothetical protein